MSSDAPSGSSTARARVLASRGCTPFALGFRPFYLGAAFFGALAVPAWYGAFRGWTRVGGPLPDMAWHAHEMLFGFAAAVIAGFLLTAARNWTGRETARGAALAGLFGLWVAGRLLNLTGPAALAAWVDASFLPVTAAVLAVPLLRARNHRNLFVVPLLVALGAANLLHHAAYLGWAPAEFQPLPQVVAVSAAAGLVALLMTVIGGRVIPAFSANAIPGLHPVRRGWLDWTVAGTMLAILLADLSPSRWGLPAGAFTALLAFAAAGHVVRLAGWRPWRTRADPLLLILPVSYAWIPVYLLLRAVLGAGVPGIPSIALHALTVGAMASLMLAMMTRSALGHTGRPLRAGAAELAIFGAIQTGALLRVAGPVLAPEFHALWVGLSSGAVALAFGVFAAAYWPILMRPRIDGRPG
jgi:uncharacterized protein involved in response to NO